MTERQYHYLLAVHACEVAAHNAYATPEFYIFRPGDKYDTAEAYNNIKLLRRELVRTYFT
jgi:hypothetical protein